MTKNKLYAVGAVDLIERPGDKEKKITRQVKMYEHPGGKREFVQMKTKEKHYDNGNVDIVTTLEKRLFILPPEKNIGNVAMFMEHARTLCNASEYKWETLLWGTWDPELGKPLAEEGDDE